MHSQPHRARARNLRILLSGGTGVAQRVAQMASALITLPLMLHALGVAGFGIWGAATSLAWAAGMLDFGLGAALVTLLPEALAKGEDVRALVSASLFGGIALGAAFILAGGLFVLADPNLRPGPPFILAGTAMALNIPLGIAGNIWFGLHKGYVAGIWEMVMTGLMLALLIAGAWLGAGVAAMTGCVYVAMLLANAGSLLHLLAFYPRLRPRPAAISAQIIRRVLHSGLSLSALSIIATSAYVLDNVLTLHWLGPAAAAQMTVAMRLCITATGMLGVATQALWPAFVEAVAHDDHGWVLRSLTRGTLSVMALAAGGSALIIAFGARALHLWLHQNLHIGPALLWTMGFWIIVMSAPRVAALLLNAVLRFRGQILVQSLVTPACLGLKFLLAARFGATGILAATPLLWLVIICPAYAWMAADWIGRPKLMKAAT